MMKQVAMLTAAVLALGGCKLDKVKGSGGIDIDDPKDLDEVIDEAQQAANKVEICPGFTLAELLKADALSDECRDSLLSFLPKEQNDFQGRLVAPGGARVEGDEVRFLLQGANREGEALLAADLEAELEVSVVAAGGVEVLAEGDFEVVLSADLPEDLLAISVVNDYSASMLEGDLDDVEALEQDLFGCLPAIHETEVLRFSESVETVQPFTSDRDAILAALAPDDDFERSSTALFDAAGQAANDLGERERPVRLLLLSTDGRENASTMFDEPELLAALSEQNVFVVVFGALLADVDQLKTLARGRGVYFYTREFRSLAAAAAPFCDSLRELIEVRIPEAAAGAESVRVRSGGIELTLSID